MERSNESMPPNPNFSRIVIISVSTKYFFDFTANHDVPVITSGSGSNTHIFIESGILCI